MTRFRLPVFVLAAALSAGSALSAESPRYLPAGDSFRDCEDVFGFYGTVDGQRFNPYLPGEFGQLSIEGFLADPYATKRRATSFAAWKISVETADGIAVRSWHGSLRFAPGRPAPVQVSWDGRDDRGDIVPAGTWWLVFRARSVPEDLVSPLFRDALFSAPEPPRGLSLDDVAAMADMWEDSPFTDGISLRVDPAWTEADVLELRLAGRLPVRSSGAQVQRVSAPHEAGYPYSFWYGNPHAHTTRSDGGGDASAADCASTTGRVDGAYPGDFGARLGAYTIARTIGDSDFLFVAEHDHLIDDALNSGDTRSPSGTGATLPTQVYHQGLDDANAATSGTFVGAYGYEFGTITGCGHVNIYDAPVFMASNPDPTPSFAFTPEVSIPRCEYADAGDLFDLANQPGSRSPATNLPHVVLNHPTDAAMFESYKKTAFSDAAVRGVAVVSGSATSCAENFPTGGTGSTGTYKNRYIQLLNAGWKVAPEAHQDNHGDNFGNHSEVRTVYLSAALTRAGLLNAQFDRRTYATQDRDGQLIFRATPTSSGAPHEMGEEIGGQGGVNFHVSFWQPDNDTISTYNLLRGQVGGGCTAFSCLTVVASGATGTPSGAVTIDVLDNPPVATYFYVVEITQPGKLDAYIRNTVSGPIWVNYALADSSCTPPGAPTLTVATGACTGNNLTWTAGSGTTLSYNVYRASSCGGSSTKIAGPIVGTSYSDTTAVAGVTYAYTVKGACAAGGGGESPASNCLTATRTSVGEPTNVTTVSTCSGVTINWTAAANATSYTIRRGADCQSLANLATGVVGTTYNDTTAVAGTTYTYAVRAINACAAPNGTSADAGCVAGTRSLPTPPAPTGVAAVGSCSGVSVSWSAAAGATSYTVLRGATCGAVAPIATGISKLAYVDTGATPGVTYQYAVIAVNACGSSPASSCVAGTRLLSVPVPSPTNLTALAGNPGPSVYDMTVSWDNVIASGSYSVYRATGNCASGTFSLVQSQPRVAGARNSWVDTAVVAGTTYCYRAVATDPSACDSPQSACSADACSVAGGVPEVSGSGAVEKLTLARTLAGGALVRFQALGTSYRYHLYVAPDGTAVGAGNYAARYCNLKQNSAGTWTEGAGYNTFEISDLGAFPAGDIVVVAELGVTEGPYGFDSGGTLRSPNVNDSIAQFDCTASPTVLLEQHWSDTGLITTDDTWPTGIGIVGYRGDGLTSSTGVNPQTVIEEFKTSPPNVVVDVNANQTNPDTFTSGGVSEFHIADPCVALNGSGTADAPSIVLSVSSTGYSTIQVAYNLRDLDGSTDNAVQAVALQYRTATSGNFTNVPAGFVADATTGPSLATLVTPVSVTLPAGAGNQATLQIRIITTNAAGNDEWVGIDDIVVTGTP